MMIDLPFFLLCVFTALGLVVLGYIVGRMDDSDRQPQHPFRQAIPYMSDKPGGIFSDRPMPQQSSGVPRAAASVPSGPIQRPTAEQYKKWNEDAKTKAEKEAISEDLAKDPELVQLKNDYTKMAASQQ